MGDRFVNVFASPRFSDAMMVAIAAEFFEVYQIKGSRFALGLNEKTVRIIKRQDDRCVDRFESSPILSFRRREEICSGQENLAFQGVVHPLYLAPKPCIYWENARLFLSSLTVYADASRAFDRLVPSRHCIGSQIREANIQNDTQQSTTTEHERWAWMN
jgi:hypothetical protein